MTPMNLASVVNRLRRLCLLPRLFLGCVVLAACQGTGDQGVQADYPPIVSSSFGEMRNVSVSDPVWFGGSPCREDLELAKRRGIKRVIDLSSSNEELRCDVAAICKELEVEYFTASVSAAGQQGDEGVDLVLGWLAPESAVPTLMFDGSGARCATFVAIHRAVSFGVPVDEALTEARRAGMRPGASEDFVRRQIERLTADPSTGKEN
jgi:protein tyrosine phosphatase (PTP) superfamily phosphohydrolase (DUF442 family)